MIVHKSNLNMIPLIFKQFPVPIPLFIKEKIPQKLTYVYKSQY